MLRLAVTSFVVPALLLLAFQVFWFQRRVMEEEACLECLFAARYRNYRVRVKRRSPGLV